VLSNQSRISAIYTTVVSKLQPMFKQMH